MKTSEFVGKFCSKYFWYNIFAMFAVVVALLVGVVLGLDYYTHQGESVSVPDLRGHSIEDATHVLEDLGLVVEVVGSGYVRNLPPGAVLQQSPEAGKKVKPGRIIMLTLNAENSPTLVLPDIIENCSYRAAVAKLSSMGFHLTEPEYISGEKDWVYGVKYKGRNIMCGDPVDVDAKITLQVGNGQRDEADSVFYADPTLDVPSDDEFLLDDDDDFEITI